MVQKVRGTNGTKSLWYEKSGSQLFDPVCSFLSSIRHGKFEPVLKNLLTNVLEAKI